MIRIIRSDETFLVNDQNQIYRTGRCWTSPSNDWLLVGAVEMKMVFGNWIIIRHFSIDDILDLKVPFKFKNGKQRCFLMHLDHGSFGVWVSPNYRIWVSGKGYDNPV